MQNRAKMKRCGTRDDWISSWVEWKEPLVSRRMLIGPRGNLPTPLSTVPDKCRARRSWQCRRSRPPASAARPKKRATSTPSTTVRVYQVWGVWGMLLQVLVGIDGGGVDFGGDAWRGLNDGRIRVETIAGKGLVDVLPRCSKTTVRSRIIVVEGKTTPIKLWSRACWLCAHKYRALFRSPLVFILPSTSISLVLGALAPSRVLFSLQVRVMCGSAFALNSCNSHKAVEAFLFVYWPICGLCLFGGLWEWVEGLRGICRKILVRAHCIWYLVWIIYNISSTIY